MKTQNNYVESIINLISKVADQYGLILAKSEFTYYIMNDLIHTLPMLTEQLGQIRAIGIGAEEELTYEESKQIIALTSSSEHYLKELEHGRKATLQANSSSKRSFDTLSETVIVDTYDFLENVKGKLLKEDYDTTSDEFYSYATRAIN